MIRFSEILFFDTETTGVPPKGAKWESDFKDFPHVVQLSWFFEGREENHIIKPDGWEIPEAAAAIHGITTERALAEGKPFAEVINNFLLDAVRCRKIVAHNIYFDTSIIKANVLAQGPGCDINAVNDALDKDKRIDTMRASIKYVGAVYSNGRPGKFPTLSELYAKITGGKTFDAHDAKNDVMALVEIFPRMLELGLVSIDEEEDPGRDAELFDAEKEPVKTESVEKAPEPENTPTSIEEVMEDLKRAAGPLMQHLEKNFIPETVVLSAGSYEVEIRPVGNARNRTAEQTDAMPPCESESVAESPENPVEVETPAPAEKAAEKTVSGDLLNDDAELF